MSNNRQQVIDPISGLNVVPHCFSCVSYEKLLDELTTVIDEGRYIPLVQGIAGVGKSTFIYQFQQAIPATWKLCRIDANPMMHQDQLMARMALDFGVVEEDDWLPKRLITRLNDLYLTGFMPVVVVDDAHLLPESTIAALIRFFHSDPNDNYPVRILLFARPEISQLLKHSEIEMEKVRSIQSYEFPALTVEQLVDYIACFLPSKKSMDRAGFNANCIAEIYRDSQGIPGLIERKLKNIRRKKGFKPSISFLLKVYFKPIFVVSFMLVLLAYLFLVEDFQQSKKSQQAQDKQADDGVSVIKIIQPVEQKKVELKPIIKKKTQHIDADIVEPVMEPIGRDDVVSQPVEPLKSIEKESIKQKPRLAIAKVEVKTLAIKRKQAVNNKIKVAAKTKTSSEVHAVNWINKQRPNYYTLQLMASRKVVDMQQFIKRANLPGDLAYFRSVQRGKQPWYVLIYGVYKTRSKALLVKTRLPKRMRDAGVWPRTFQSIHRESQRQ